MLPWSVQETSFKNSLKILLFFKEEIGYHGNLFGLSAGRLLHKNI